MSSQLKYRSLKAHYMKVLFVGEDKCVIILRCLINLGGYTVGSEVNMNLRKRHD